jgi:hypothetical protein
VIGRDDRKSREPGGPSFVHSAPAATAAATASTLVIFSPVQSGKQDSSVSLSSSTSSHGRDIDTTRTQVDSQWSPTSTRVRGPPCRSSAAVSPFALLLLQLPMSCRVRSTRHSSPTVLRQMASPDAADAASSPLRLPFPTDKTTTTPTISMLSLVRSASVLYLSLAV